MSDDKPTCGAKIEKEWPGHRVVLSRTYCRRRVKAEGDRCWQHPDFRRELQADMETTEGWV